MSDLITIRSAVYKRIYNIGMDIKLNVYLLCVTVFYSYDSQFLIKTKKNVRAVNTLRMFLRIWKSLLFPGSAFSGYTCFFLYCTSCLTTTIGHSVHFPLKLIYREHDKFDFSFVFFAMPIRCMHLLYAEQTLLWHSFVLCA